MPQVVTIPKEFIRNGELVILPRKKYDELLNWQKAAKTFKPTTAQKKALAEARENRKKGNVLTLDELKDKLGLRD